MKRKPGGDNREMILCGFNKYIKVQDKNENERRNREVLILVKDAEMEGRVVEEAIVVGIGGGTRRFCRSIIKEGPTGD